MCVRAKLVVQSKISRERVLLHFGPPERSVGSSGRRDRARVPGRLVAPVHSSGLHTAAQIHQPRAPQTGRDPQTGPPAARARPVLYRHHVRAGDAMGLGGLFAVAVAMFL